ncbi:MAG TPA: DNA-processing protein DprA [Candidatus Polarisedimenticolia bacterium]|nr:DNA-processing protein DprA [Candidatus Polarisedimenticolia bacterium]
MARTITPDFIEGTPEDFLGPLNDVERKNAPDRLFLAGERALLQNTVRVAIVGSRRSSKEGAARAARLARSLARAGIVVTSGLAEGIDFAAHLGTMEAEGRTIAVLGTPLDQAYPAKHTALQARLVSEHLVVTQFPLGVDVSRHFFVQRNRTMALICHGSVIVEAGEGSGTLSQGWEALRLGRPLFIMASAKMLDYGAQVLRDEQDLIAFLPDLPVGEHAGAAF